MKIKFFSKIRTATGCKDADIPHEGDVRSLADVLCEKYGDQLRRMMMQNGDISPEIIILVNGRNICHMDGIKTKLGDNDTVSVFPIVGGG